MPFYLSLWFFLNFHLFVFSNFWLNIQKCFSVLFPPFLFSFSNSRLFKFLKNQKVWVDFVHQLAYNFNPHFSKKQNCSRGLTGRPFLFQLDIFYSIFVLNCIKLKTEIKSRQNCFFPLWRKTHNRLSQWIDLSWTD